MLSLTGQHLIIRKFQKDIIPIFSTLQYLTFFSVKVIYYRIS